MMSDILNFKQGRIADTRENVEMIQQRIEVIDEKIEHHDNQIDKQTVFSKVESIESDDNLYHMTISVNDGSGSLEVVDKADEDTTDGKMSVVGLNMYKSSIASLMNDVNELKNSIPTIIEAETPQIVGKYVWKDPDDAAHHLIICPFNRFPANARINYDVKYIHSDYAKEVVEKGYITTHDFFWEDDDPQCFTTVPTERTLTDEALGASFRVIMEYYLNQEKGQNDRTKQQMTIELRHCSNVISSEFEIVLEEKKGVYSAAQVDAMLSQLTALIDSRLNENDPIHWLYVENA